MTKEIIRRKPRTPHQVEHGLGKMLIGFTNDASFLSRRIFPGKGAFEIGHGNASATGIDNRRDGTENLGQRTDGGPRKKWHDFRRYEQADEFEPITQFLPRLPHTFLK